MSDPAVHPLISNIPYQRNPFFTGREELLNRLHDLLYAENTAALTQPQGISGLGGIGKTQTALEYVYRYHTEYRAVLWARADSHAILTSDFVRIAHLLDLPEKDEQDQNHIVEAVMRWLRIHSCWLLILDNVEELAVAAPFIPLASRGHILMTTRAQAMGGIAQPITIGKMSPEVGALLLLRRAGFLPSDRLLDAADADERAQAMEISRVLDGLPLALDQAGAYIKETPCSFSDYLLLYRERASDLLNARDNLETHYPHSVATTWSLSFEKVVHTNPAAAELLYCCAFLYPEGIPEEIITDGASHLGPTLRRTAVDPLRLNEALSELLKYSLVQRQADPQTLAIHRLVQTVLREKMSNQRRRQWSKRVVRAVNHVFPEVEVEAWPLCQRYLLHAQECAEHIARWDMMFPEAVRLLHLLGDYLECRGQYREAKSILQRSLAIFEQVAGPEDPAIGICLNNLGELCRILGEYAEAESLYYRALAIYEQAPGAEDHSVAVSLNNLALLHADQGRYEQADPLYQKVLAIYKRVLGLEHPDTATCLNNLGGLYHAQGKYEQAEAFFQQALAIREQILGPGHPDTANTLNNLALLYSDQGKHEQAEAFFQQALAIREQILGLEHPLTANVLDNLALLYDTQGKYEQAEPLYRRSLRIHEQVLGPEHPSTANVLYNLADLYRIQGKYDLAEPLFHQARAVREQVFGPAHPFTADTFNALARLYRAQGKYDLAEPLFQQALFIREQKLKREHPRIAISLNDLAELYESQEKYKEAELLYQEALFIRGRVLRPDHPDMVQSLNNLAGVYQAQSRFEEAESLLQRAFGIWEHIRLIHPYLAVSLNKLALLYNAQGKREQAELLFQKALTIQEKTLGLEHPDRAKYLSDLAELYESEGKYEQAVSLYEQALKIRERSVGLEHPQMIALRRNYTDLLRRIATN